MTRLIEASESCGLTAEIRDGIACVTLTQLRMSWRMLSTLAGLPQKCIDAGARGILVRGAHDDFCHGIDLSDPEILRRVQQDAGESVANLGSDMVAAWCQTPLPTVVEISNWTIGAGACLAFACDFRIAAPLTRVSFPEIDRGMHLSWGILPRLLSECGAPLTRRLAMLGDPVTVEDFPAEVFIVTDAPDLPLELVQQMASKPMTAFAAIKEALSAETMANAAYRARDIARFTETVASDDFLKAMAEWFEGRAK